MQLTRESIINTYNALSTFPRVANVKVAYALAKNKRNLDAIVGVMREMQQPAQEFIDYESKRISLCMSYADKDVNGDPKSYHNNFVIMVDRETEFREKLDALNTEHKTEIEAQDKRLQEVKEFLKGSEEVEIHKIKLSALCDAVDGIEPAVMDSIFDLIDPNEDSV